VALVAAGVVVLGLSGGSTAVEVLSMVLLGLGFIWVVSLAFFIVGRSEDDERAAAERRGAAPVATPGTGRAKLKPRAPMRRRRDHD
jgi:hypothetical protein